MLKDAFGNVAEVGDIVAYAPGGAGAQGFFTGVISKVTERRVMISGHGERDCMGDTKKISRSEGCFVIGKGSRK